METGRTQKKDAGENKQKLRRKNVFQKKEKASTFQIFKYFFFLHKSFQKVGKRNVDSTKLLVSFILETI